MKYIVAAVLAALSASPAFAGGSRGGLIGPVFAPITTAVSALNVNALNHVSVLSNDKVNVNAPITVSKNNILSGLLGGGSHGCGCN